MSYNGDRSYYTTSRNDRSQPLPPLREILPEQFPTRAGHDSRSSHSQHSGHSSTHTSRHSSTSYHHPPDDNRRPPSRNGTHGSYPHQSHSGPAPHHSETASSNHTFTVHRLSPSEGLVHERSSTRDAFPTRPQRQTDDPSRRYVCEKCGDRFDRPISLETHMRTHTGEKPFECSHSGCHKTFTTQSNTRRHERTHGYAGAFEAVDEEENSHDSRSSRHHSSTHSSTPSSQYYTVTR